MAIIDEIPKSRISIKYETDINGEKVQREIPLRLLVMGDLSAGTSKDAKLDLSERNVRELDGKNLDATMKDMGITLSFAVDNKINPEKEPALNVDIPIDSMKAFNPSTIAERVPEIKSLLILKQMVKELETTVDNNKVFRQHLGEILADPEVLEAVKKQFPNLANFSLPDPNKLPAAPEEEGKEEK